MESLTFVALFKVRSNILPYSTCSFVDVQKNTKKNRKMSRKKTKRNLPQKYSACAKNGCRKPFCLDDSIAICINVNMLIVSRVSSAEDGSEFSNKECPAFFRRGM